MDNFVRNIRKKIVEVEVTGRPEEGEPEAPAATRSSGRDIKVREVRVHISALSSEQVCASLSQTKNRVKDEGRSDNQLRVRAQALQPERPWPLDEEVLRGGGVWLIFEVITVGLFRELSVSAHLKEIDLAGDCHKKIKRVHKHFLKRFAYLCR